VRSSGSLEQLKSISKKLSIPISTTWTAVDAMDFEDEYFAERPGVVGTRAGNFITQKSDLIIILGTRLPIRQVSYNFENFAKNAIKVGIDIDYQELTKPMVELDIKIHANLKSFINELELCINEFDKPINPEFWLTNIKEIKEEFPPLESSIKERGHEKYLNPYIFIDNLWGKLKSNDIIACADASASVIPLQIAKIKYGQRLFTNAGSASMGYDIPAAIGASLANPKSRIICIAGDGSIMLNIQDLETVNRYKLNIKIILLNNEGYLSIKLSQQGFFKRQKGSGINSGLNFPNFEKVALANDIPYVKIQTINDYSKLEKILESSGPSIIEVMIDPSQSFEPKLGSFIDSNGKIESNSLENMTPLINKEKLESIMKVKNYD
jgi:acetolactate synthase-1/2/3 large subunit